MCGDYYNGVNVAKVLDTDEHANMPLQSQMQHDVASNFHIHVPDIDSKCSCSASYEMPKHLFSFLKCHVQITASFARIYFTGQTTYVILHL